MKKLKKKTYKKLLNRFCKAAATQYTSREDDWMEYIPCFRPVGGKYARFIINRLWWADGLEEYFIHSKPAFNSHTKYVFVWDETIGSNYGDTYLVRRASDEDTQHTIIEPTEQ